jgi:hypothetical protein
MVEDYKKLVAHYTGVDAEYISVTDVVSLLMNIVYPIVSKTESKFKEFVTYLSPDEYWRCRDNQEDYDFYKALIMQCNSILQNTQVRGEHEEILLDLGEPSESVLPLSGGLDVFHNIGK